MDEMPSFDSALALLGNIDDDRNEIPESEDTQETNVIVTALSDEAKLRMEVIQSLISASENLRVKI